MHSKTLTNIISFAELNYFLLRKPRVLTKLNTLAEKIVNNR